MWTPELAETIGAAVMSKGPLNANAAIKPLVFSIIAVTNINVFHGLKLLSNFQPIVFARKV